MIIHKATVTFKERPAYVLQNSLFTPDGRTISPKNRRQVPTNNFALFKKNTDISLNWHTNLSTKWQICWITGHVKQACRLWSNKLTSVVICGLAFLFCSTREMSECKFFMLPVLSVLQHNPQLSPVSGVNYFMYRIPIEIIPGPPNARTKKGATVVLCVN